MKKKVFSLLLALLLIVGSIPLNLLSIAAEEIDKLADGEETPTPPIVTIEPTERHWIYNKSKEAPAKPDASGNAHFIIKATGDITEDITVYYATEDITAIAESGDYKATSGSVVLTKENSQVEISIETKIAEYAIILNSDRTIGGYYRYDYLARSFKVKLTGVSGGGAKLNDDKREVECALNAEHNLEAYEYSGATVLTPFTYHGKYEIYNFLTTDTCASDETVSKTVALNFPASWAADYIDGAIDAKLYMALVDAHVDESWWNSSTGITVEFLDTVVQIKGEFHDNEEFGWAPAFLYVKNNVEDGADGIKNKYKDYYNENYQSVSWESFAGPIRLAQGGLIYNLTYMLRGKTVIRRAYNYGEPAPNSDDTSEYYIGLRDDVLKWTQAEVKLTSHGGYSRQISKGAVEFRLEDITAPKIKTTTSGAYEIYHNFDTVTKNDKLRIAIRFSEPVQVRGRTPFFVGKINGLGTGVEPNPYAIRFTYVGGSGTDTLYFEADYNGEYQINSITDIQFRYADSITDFGGVANTFSAPSNIVIDGFNIDRRNPTISVSSSDSHMSPWGKSKSVSVTVSNISDGTVLYYAWSDKKDEAPNFDNQVTLNNVSVNGAQTVKIFGDGDGTKYLHLKVVSKYGREQHQISIVGETVKFQNYLGPYNFDNTPPVVDESKLLPIDSSSDMSTKKYSIPIPSDASSKNIELKVYYVDENGEANCLESKTYMFTERDTKPLELVLTAADFGIGDGEDGRRVVTVFFTLSDEVGNIDSDVARHRLIFDTREYIQVGHAGATSQFAGMTDTLDEGYILVYNGDVQGTDGRICFGFEFTGINDLSGERIYLFLYKNGEPLHDADVEVIEEIDHQAGKLIGLTVNFKSPLDAGYYDIYLGTFEDDDVTYEDIVAGRLPDHVSETYRFYVGAGKGNLDEQINKGTMLINKVYQLPSLSYFYYMDNNSTIGSINKGAYNGTTLAASFSSKNKALEYVLFNEYRDLYAVTLTAELAEALNTGNSNVQKALGEETIAREGQVWIRYKSASWTPGKAPNSTNWVFYYYGTSENLDITRFSSILTNALNSVATAIVEQGKTVALTDISIKNGGTGASLVDRYGVPYLAPLQIHTEDKRLADENLNGRFVNDVIFTADTAIYSSGVIINAVEYNLLGNVVIPEGSRLQYKRIDESGVEDPLWTEIIYTYGQRFGDVIAESGRYKIRELGEDGISVINTYIDKDAPMVLISWRDKDGASNSQIINQASEKEFRGKTLRIVGIDAREYDKYSYVALYKASDSSLYGVYTLTELQKSAVDIDNGNYYMVVADRSGNSYVMTLNINSSNLSPDVKINENVKIKFTCDRKESQIQEFYVKRNGVLVSGKYAPELEFTESGTYEFYVRDIYGNVYGPEVYEFNRVYPEVSWKYRDESGYFVAYDPNNKTKYFSLESTVDGIFTLSTSVNLKFQISGDYGFTFVGIAPQYEENIRDSTVTIKTTQAFQLKVFYKKHPEVFTIYNCSADTVAPVIEASVQIDSFVPNELEELRQLIAAGDGSNAGNKLIPSKISYSLVDTQTRYLTNHDTVLSDFINVNVYDESGLAYVHVYLNGNLIKDLNAESASSGIILSKSGEYRIVAEDALGNKSEFNFTNGTLNSFSYAVDGFPMRVGLRDHENFDENGNYTDITYGNESVSFYMYDSMKIFYMITDSDGEKYFVAFDIDNSMIREVYYCADSENNLALETSDKVLLDGNDPKTVADKEYVIYEIREIGLKIFGRVSASGVVILSIYVDEGSQFTVESRLNTANEEFYYTKTELSSYFADLLLGTSDGILRIKETDDLIKMNRTFTISRSNFVSEKVSLVEVYYSTTNNFSDMGIFELMDIYEDDAYYEEEGFYYIRLVNQYGNESTFIIHISYKFDVTSYSEFADGQKIYYSVNQTGTIYSNNKVVFEVYSTGVVIDVKKDGKKYQPVVNIGNGITYVVLSDPGKYTVSLSDSYKNNIERSAEIDVSGKEFNESLLTGYNENALRREEGYTNQKLSINKTVIEKDKISYLALEYGDNFYLLYDTISESGVALDESKLTDIIGQYGDGKYILIARNRYGTLMTKEIHYRETPTLILERELRTGTEPEPYDIEKAISSGFWSNGELIFRTEAENYVFTINGDKTECPKTLTFSSADQQGRSEYVITYRDEYGFSYSFKAYLLRQDLEIIPGIGEDSQEINGILTTTDDIIMFFSESAYCTYTWNNSEEKVYTPGTRLTRDGTYRFIAQDYAGNMSALTVKKDTTVEFEFVETNSAIVLQSGGVVNSSRVDFKTVNNDSAFIEQVFINGVLQEGFSDTRFSQDGKWEFIISDKLGNKSYFCFYIITKQKSSFAYTTPYEYRVTELWHDNGDGVKVSYFRFVNHSDTSSNFEFTENGKYFVVMTSTLTGSVSRFEFTINTNAPEVSLVGCNPGETTINDVTISGCIVGDTVKVYRKTDTGDELFKEVEVTSLSTQMPTINEGGEYRVVVESEAGVTTELSFVRKHVMNTEGSIFIMIVIGVAVIGLFTGLVYRNKSKTDK